MIGFLRIDKPQGVTSHDVVSHVRRALGVRRVGHAGTLDPFASGLLLVCVGGATRLMEYIHSLDKVYEAEAQLGVMTDTDDLEGSVVGTQDTWRTLDIEQVTQALQGRTGSVLQLPPAYSAKKIGGEPAHRRLRRGESVELAPSRVEIHDVKLLSMDLPQIRFRIRCGTGTYIRAFARDVGEDLGCGAHLTELRRTRIGPHRVDDALSLDAVAPDRLLPPEQVVSHLPSAGIAMDVVRRLRHGQRVAMPQPPNAAPNEPLALLASPQDGEVPLAEGLSSLVGVGCWRDGVLHPMKILPGVQE